MGKLTTDMLQSPEFKKLVRKRWTVAITLAVLEFVLYYGYIVLIGINKPLMATKIGEVTTLGIPFGVAVILISFILTYIYVIWANNKYDPEVKRLIQLLGKG